MTITHITPRETALERENERLLSTLRFQAEAIELIRSELAKVQPVQSLPDVHQLRDAIQQALIYLARSGKFSRSGAKDVLTKALEGAKP